jgi:hypothetical protein
MRRDIFLLLAAASVLLAAPAWCETGTFTFSTGLPDGKLAAASRIPGGALIEIEAADDFITTKDQTIITAASFWGLLPNPLPAVEHVAVEIYRVFPLDSVDPPDGRVPTRANSPSDVAFDTRSSEDGQLTFTATSLGAFTAANSVLNGINPKPNQTTLGEGPRSGIQVRFDVIFATPFTLPPGHYFFVPQARLDGGNTFFWLSAPRNPALFIPNLQAWIRNANLDPDWLRIGTDIIGGDPAPTFDMAFTLAGVTQDAALVAAVLPSSRSVQVGTPATAFATVINPGVGTAHGVGITLNTGVPATFTYQTTDPATNQITGTPDTPVDIPPGKSQTFVVALTPTSPFAPTDVAFAFGGGNAPVLSGIDTLLLSASTTPVSDIVALAATAGNTGIVNIPGAHGNGAFAVATVNVGIGGDITVSADTGGATLPVIIFLCQTDSNTGQCVKPATPSTNPVVATIGANATATFGIFVAGTGNIPFNAAANRIFVRFKDAATVTRGSTSVAVRTQ